MVSPRTATVVDVPNAVEALERRYFAIQKCSSFLGYAILCSWDDVLQLMEREERKEHLVYCEFTTLMNAAHFLDTIRINVRGTSRKNEHMGVTAKWLETPNVPKNKRARDTRYTRHVVHRRSSAQEQEEFDTMLCEWSRVIGHLKEPLNRHPKLQEWARRMRGEYDSMAKKQNTTMTPHRITQLAAAGFTFQTKTKKTWDQRAIEWLEYRAKHNGEEPKRWDATGLWKWIYNQRDKYRQLQQGKKTNLTEEQVR